MKIEKAAEIAAPVSAVWAAVAHAEEFEKWFRAKLDGPFVAGAGVRGHSTYPGHEDAKFEILVDRVEPPIRFGFAWKSPEESAYRSVEFRLSSVDAGTLLQVTESGFESMPGDRREKALRDNEAGWEIQLRNIREHVEKLI